MTTQGDYHHELVDAVCGHLQRRFGMQIYVDKQHNMLATTEWGGKVKIGHPGRWDIAGVVQGGLRFEIEVKTGRAKLGPRQWRYRDEVLMPLGVPHLLLRSRAPEAKEESLREAAVFVGEVLHLSIVREAAVAGRFW